MAHVEPGDARDEQRVQETRVQTAREYYAVKSTPGPWKLDGGKGKRGELYVWSDRDEKGKGYIGTHEICVAVVKPKARCEGAAAFAEEEIAANAALIAASPELLRMLKKFLAAARCNYDPRVMLAQFGVEAEAVIAKADPK